MDKMKKRADRLNGILDKRGSGIQIICTDVWRNNSMQTAYILKKTSSNCCPVIPYEKEWDGCTDEAVADLFVQMADKESRSVDVKSKLTADRIKSHILPRVVNGSNLGYLREKGIACCTYLDLAVLYYLPIEDMALQDGSRAHVQITDCLLSFVGMTGEEAHSHAMSNLANSVDAMPIDAMLSELLLQRQTPYGQPDYPSANLWVVTNKDRLFGAAMILFDKALYQTFGAAMGQKIAVLPSSVHEILITTYQDDRQLQDLLEIVKEVNTSIVSSEERLSDNVYFYDHTKDHVCALVSKPETKIAEIN